jgi:hypothetical protein
MEANELRIGNYVKMPNLIKPIKVSIIDTTQNSTKTKAQPIPLTEEWLLNFGFELLYTGKFRKVYDFSKDLRFGYQDNYGLANIESSVTFVGNSFKHIKYVHQLQNLYFALTGNELIFKDK